MSLRVTRVQIEGSCGYVPQADEVVVIFTLSRKDTAALPSSPLHDSVHDSISDWLNYIVEVENQ